MYLFGKRSATHYTLTLTELFFSVPVTGVGVQGRRKEEGDT